MAFRNVSQHKLASILADLLGADYVFEEAASATIIETLRAKRGSCDDRLCYEAVVGSLAEAELAVGYIAAEISPALIIIGDAGAHAVAAACLASNIAGLRGLLALDLPFQIAFPSALGMMLIDLTKTADGQFELTMAAAGVAESLIPGVLRSFPSGVVFRGN